MKAMDLFDFDNHVGMLFGDDFDELDIEPSDYTGAFTADRLEELIQFCGKHPEYHIVTSPAGAMTYLNRVSNNAFCYYLADGDDNPRLIGTDSVNELEFFDVESAYLALNPPTK